MAERLLKFTENKGLRLVKHAYQAVYPYFADLVGAEPSDTGALFGYGPQQVANYSDKGVAGENVQAWQEVFDNTYVTTTGGLYLDGVVDKIFEYSRGTLHKVVRQFGRDVLFFHKDSALDGRCWVSGGTTRRELLYQESWTNLAANIYAISLREYHAYTDILNVYLEDAVPDPGSNTELTEVNTYVELTTNHQYWYDHTNSQTNGAQLLYIYEDTIDPTIEHFTVNFRVNYVPYSDPEFGILPGFPHFWETGVQLNPATADVITIPDLVDCTGVVDSGYLLVGDRSDQEKNTVYRALVSDLAGQTFDVSPAVAGIAWVNHSGFTYKLSNFSTLFPFYDDGIAPLSWLKVYNKSYTRLTSIPGISDEHMWYYDDTGDTLYIHLDHLIGGTHSPEDPEAIFSAAPLKIRCGDGATWFDINKNVPNLDGGIQEMVVYGKDVILFSNTNAAKLKWIGGVTVLGETADSPFVEESIFLQDGQEEFIRALVLQNALIAVWNKGLFVLSSDASFSFEPLFRGEGFDRLFTTLRGNIVATGICYAKRRLLLQVDLPFHDYLGIEYSSQRFFLVQYEALADLLQTDTAKFYELVFGLALDGVGDSSLEPIVFAGKAVYALREDSSFTLNPTVDYTVTTLALEPIVDGDHEDYYRYGSYILGPGTSGGSFIPFVIPTALGSPLSSTSVLARVPDGHFYYGAIARALVDGVDKDVIAGFDYANVDGVGIPVGTELWSGSAFHYLELHLPIEDAVNITQIIVSVVCNESFVLYMTATTDEGVRVIDSKTVPVGKSFVRFPCNFEGTSVTVQLAVPDPKPWIMGGIFVSVDSIGEMR